MEKRRGVSSPLTAYSLFSGGGGFHIGLKRAGFNVLVATDIEPAAELTHLRNWPKTPFLRQDIRKVKGEDLIRLAKGRKPDLVFGGPPCQGFSTLGTKLSGDVRNALFDHFARVVKEIGPKCFLFENVKSLTTMYHGQFKDYIIRKFEALGYNVQYQVLDAADYGVPQHRQRVIFFGSRIDSGFKFPAPTHGPRAKGTKAYTTVQEAIGDIAKRGNDSAWNHIFLDHSDIVVERYRLIPEGGRLPPPSELPKNLRRSNFGNTYKRLDRKKPALTMVPGNNAFPIHPVENRSLTPREAARLQTFPDDHIFVGDRRRQCILVGNAVPPLLGYSLGKALKAYLVKAPKDNAKRKSVQKTTHERQHQQTLERRLPLEQITKKSDSVGFIDLFSGAGGFTLGFAKAGWKPLLSTDINPNVTATHKFNLPSLPYEEADLSQKEARDRIVKAFKGKDIGVIVGGPPCQGFSGFGKRRFVNTKGHDPHSDERNKLVYAYVDVVKRVKPRWFVMENVPGLATLDQGLFLKALLKDFSKLGYKDVEWRILNAADYGVPQMRKRLIIIGNRTGHIIPWPKKKYFKEPKDWQKPYRGVGEVLWDLEEPSSHLEQTCHVPMKHKPLLVERYSYIEEGSKLDVSKLPEHLKSGYRTDVVKNYSHVFKRLHRERPSTTMVPGHNAFPIHPTLNRALTVREAARIQTFPDELVFQGSRQEQCIQVGNAFPPLLAEVIGNGIMKADSNDWRPDNTPPSAYYALIEREGDVLEPLEIE